MRLNVTNVCCVAIHSRATTRCDAAQKELENEALRRISEIDHRPEGRRGRDGSSPLRVGPAPLARKPDHLLGGRRDGWLCGGPPPDWPLAVARTRGAFPRPLSSRRAHLVFPPPRAPGP